MTRKRGSSHTTLTQTADLIVRELEKMPGIKMIAPGIIDAKRSGKRFVTAIYTSGGMSLIVSGTGVQKIAIHLVDPKTAPAIIATLKNAKTLKQFTWGEREQKPGI